MNKRRIFALLGIIVIVLLVYLAFRVPVASVSTLAGEESPAATATAMFGNGCFWCAEADFEKVPGVVDVVSGYAGGTTENPTYENYAAGGHREVVFVTYDPMRISFAQLVEHTIKHGDPTDAEGSFYDRGAEYAPAIYYKSAAEKAAAESVISAIDALRMFEKSIALAILPSTTFYSAEEYHQDYYKKNPFKYAYYRHGSGRDAFIEKHWGKDPALSIAEQPERMSWRSFVKPSDEVLRATLTPLQYHVTQEEGTETPFDNEYDKNEAEGIYVDVVSGEPLFSSIDKYDSGTGWPSFTKPLEPGNIVLKTDTYLVYERTEVRSKYGDSHVGHVFDDGPVEAGGKRYCMNSAALRFIAKENLVAEGYGEYLALFK